MNTGYKLLLVHRQTTVDTKTATTWQEVEQVELLDFDVNHLKETPHVVATEILN